MVTVHLVFAGYLPGCHGDVIRPEDAVISLFTQISTPEGDTKKTKMLKMLILNLSLTIT